MSLQLINIGHRIYCKTKGIDWYASAWDLNSQFLRQFNLKYNKVASAMIVYKELLEENDEGKHTFISTGMTEYEDIENAVDIFNSAKCPFELCTLYLHIQ